MKRAPLIASIIGAAAVGVGTASAIMPTGAENPPDLRPRPESARGPYAAAGDPFNGRPWVVRTYATEGGLLCPEVGRADNGAFGREDPDGTFIPLPILGAGACVDPSDATVALAVREIPPGGKRRALSVLYGMVIDPDARPVLETATGERLPLSVDQRTFVFVTAGQELEGATLLVEKAGEPDRHVLLHERP